jgi:short subunit dehydrogenase-like uncharacterized protein
MTRHFEVVVYGATGFTGRLVAAYLAGHAPGLRWALAGRRQAELTRLAGELPGATPAVIVADAGDDDALRALTARTAVVVSTAGPFMRLGAGLVAACVATGTHYADLTARCRSSVPHRSPPR